MKVSESARIPSDLAAEEKARVAVGSMLAAVGLTAAKVVVGLMTHSLGILSEAAHSALDLVGAGATALAVACIVIWVSIQLGWKTLSDLMDTVPAGLVAQARAAALAVPGVERAPRVRMRRIGGDWFADVVIQVRPGLSAEEAHAIAVAVAVEPALKPLLPAVDVVVHVAPLGADPPWS